MERFYSDKGAEAGPYLVVNFDADEVSLDIPMDGITLPSGWSIQPMVYPTKVRIQVSNTILLRHVHLPPQLLCDSVDSYM